MEDDCNGNKINEAKHSKDDDDDNDGIKDKNDNDSKNQFSNYCGLVYTLGSNDSFDNIPEGHIYWRHDPSRMAGDIEVYNNLDYLYVKVVLDPKVKPNVAFGEKDRNKDNILNESDIRSDGVTFNISGRKYEWYYHSNLQDPNVTVPNDVFESPIVYSVNVSLTTLSLNNRICVDLHASPNNYSKSTTPTPTPIPEFQSILMPMVAIIVLIIIFSKKK